MVLVCTFAANTGERRFHPKLDPCPPRLTSAAAARGRGRSCTHAVVQPGVIEFSAERSRLDERTLRVAQPPTHKHLAGSERLTHRAHNEGVASPSSLLVHRLSTHLMLEDVLF